MKALVICGFKVFREALCSVLCQMDEQPTITEATDIEHALVLQEVNAYRLDVAIVSFDILYDDLAPLESLKLRMPHVPIIIFARFESDSEARQAIALGASGCIAPADGWKRVMAVVSRVCKGEIVLSSPNNQSDLVNSADLAQKNTREEGGVDKIHLTPRQLDVLELIRRGQSNKEIARSLTLAEGTVKMHCVAIFRELGVSNRTQAAVVGDHIAATQHNQPFAHALT